MFRADEPLIDRCGSLAAPFNVQMRPLVYWMYHAVSAGFIDECTFMVQLSGM
jgi:hypothetical protein